MITLLSVRSSSFRLVFGYTLMSNRVVTVSIELELLFPSVKVEFLVTQSK